MKCDRQPPERDFKSAECLNKEMAKKHGFEPLAYEKLCGLARMVVRFRRFKDDRSNLDNIPSDDRVWKILSQTQNALSKLALLHEPTNIRLQHARSIIEGDLPYNFDTTSDFVPLSELFRLSAVIAPQLKEEIERQKSTGFIPAWHGGRQEKPGIKTKTILMGKKIPDAYRQMYPGRRFGGYSNQETLSGPGFTFTHKFMIVLGYDSVTFDAIREAKRTMQNSTTEL